MHPRWASSLSSVVSELTWRVLSPRGVSSVVSVRVELRRRLSDACLAAVFQATTAAAQANLLKQQEELERKAAELDRREQELQTRQSSSGQSTM